MKNTEKLTPSEHDTRTEEDNKRTINRLLNLYDTVLDECTSLMQEPEPEQNLTCAEKLDLLKKLTTVADPLMRRWNITHQGYDSSVRMAQDKKDNSPTAQAKPDDSPTPTPQAKPAEQNETNKFHHVREIEPGVMELCTLSPAGEEDQCEIVKVQEIEPDVFEIIDPDPNGPTTLHITQRYHPDMLEILKTMMIPFPEEEDESESTASVDTPAVNPNAPDT
ncbi:hypothetical protein C6501_00750 [Candidatus Poribacteria bacterium]|nr:MAG: hypothetical protein C6501_00750 [Candidatus Poribacteria bacterium]